MLRVRKVPELTSEEVSALRNHWSNSTNVEMKTNLLYLNECLCLTTSVPQEELDPDLDETWG